MLPVDPPSRTALGVAVHRAIHQELEGGKILWDPLALRILGPDARLAGEGARRDPSVRALRLFLAVRSRFAEDTLAAAVPQGIGQLVILGAGLDTFAYRSDLAPRLQIFEVDHPATQAWKRQRLSQAAIAVPPTLTFVPTDLEKDDLAAELAACGFDGTRPSFFICLGVVPYLTHSAVFSTLRYIGQLCGGAQVVFDYLNPPEEAHEQSEPSAQLTALQARVASLGEPFQSHFETEGLHAVLRELGFRQIEDLGPAGIRQRYFGQPAPGHSNKGAHIARASTKSGVW